MIKLDRNKMLPRGTAARGAKIGQDSKDPARVALDPAKLMGSGPGRTAMAKIGGAAKSPSKRAATVVLDRARLMGIGGQTRATMAKIGDSGKGGGGGGGG